MLEALRVHSHIVLLLLQLIQGSKAYLVVSFNVGLQIGLQMGETYLSMLVNMFHPLDFEREERSDIPDGDCIIEIVKGC